MDMEFVIIIVLTVLLPLWMILHYGSKKHAHSRLTPDDERMLEDLWRSAKEMERRMGALEAIVEPDAPRTAAWRPDERPAGTVM